MVVRRRLNITGPALFFVTTTVVDWKPVFGEKDIALAVLGQLDDALRHFGISLAGYVLMPSHLHTLLGMRDARLLSRFMHSFKILSSKKVKSLPQAHKYGLFHPDGTFSLWKPRFDDLMIVSQEQFRIKLDYIHNNPVKSNLVRTAEEWPYSSASAWNLNKTGILTVEKDFKWY